MLTITRRHLLSLVAILCAGMPWSRAWIRPLIGSATWDPDAVRAAIHLRGPFNVPSTAVAVMTAHVVLVLTTLMHRAVIVVAGGTTPSRAHTGRVTSDHRVDEDPRDGVLRVVADACTRGSWTQPSGSRPREIPFLALRPYAGERPA